MPRVTGAHAIIHSRHPEADRAFFRSVLGFPSVDAGDGWLIFALPPAEVAVHPADENGTHELYLMVDDVRGFASDLAARGVSCTPPRDLRWGVLTQLTLPGGGTLGVYEPRHPRPPSGRRAKSKPAPLKTKSVGTKRRRRRKG
jgi:hypothetical protein